MSTAVEQIMQWVESQDDLPYDFKVPNDTMTTAIAEGLASRFSFIIRYTPAESNPNGDDAVFFAAIYPNGMDSTWQGADFIAPMLPEADIAHECMETEWHFDAARFPDPASIARLLTARGFAFDADGQKYYADEAKIFADVQKAVAFEKAAQAFIAGEGKYGAEDPAEGRVITTKTTAPKPPKR